MKTARHARTAVLSRPPGGAPPAGRRERRRIEVRGRLLLAALRLFAERGFSATTVEDITDAADVGKGTFFNHFPGKDHILVAFADAQLDLMREFVTEAQGASVSVGTLLQRLTARMTEEPDRNPAIVRTLLLANLSSEPVRLAIAERQAAATALMGQLIRIGQERGEIRGDRPAKELAQALRQLISGTFLLWSLRPEGALRKRMESALQLLWTGMIGRTPRAARPRRR